VVSRVDAAAEAIIRTVILEAFPGDQVIGEELGASGDGERCWVIDPLDNTACYLRGSNEYAVIIGLVVGTRPAVGVVTTPEDGAMWQAAVGHGAWGPDGQHLRCSDLVDLKQATVTFASLKTWHNLGLVGPLGRVVTDSFHESLHGGFRGMLAVSTGTVDLCLDPWGSLWDHAGLVPLLQESGAVCRRLVVPSGLVGLVTGPASLVEAARDRGLPVSNSPWTPSSYRQWCRPGVIQRGR
jgi:histidinol-phosphatase